MAMFNETIIFVLLAQFKTYLGLHSEEVCKTIITIVNDIVRL